MKLKTTLILLISHGVVAFIGFALGIYSLPILTAPASPTTQQLSHISSQAIYKAKFTRDLAGSDALHWGDGDVMAAIERYSVSADLREFEDLDCDCKVVWSVEIENDLSLPVPLGTGSDRRGAPTDLLRAP